MGGIIFNSGERDIYPVDAPPSGENRIKTVDYLPYLALAENADYVLGTANGTGITRYPQNGDAPVAGVAVTACYTGDGITLIGAGATSASATLDIVGERFAAPRNVGAWA